MGDWETGALASVESPLKYHPLHFRSLTRAVKPVCGQCQVGGLTGAVTSQRVTEVREGLLALVGNQRMSAKAKGGLTARLTSRAGTKVGLSDPTTPSGRVVA